MIQVHRLNNDPMIVNADMIEFIEATPDTIVTMVSGKKLLVKDTVDEVIQRIIRYKQIINQALSVKP